MAFKMKGHTLPGINQRMDKSSLEDGRAKSSAFQKDKDKSVSEKQTVIDEKNISENTNQPVQGMISNADHKENVKSVKRQNRINTQKMSRKEIQNELKKRKKEGVNKSEFPNDIPCDVPLVFQLISQKVV